MQRHTAIIKTNLSSSHINIASDYFNQMSIVVSSPTVQIKTLNTGNSLTTVQIDYVLLENPRLVSFAGFGYDVDSGYITLTSSDDYETMGLLNLNELMTYLTAGKFNLSLFLYNLERYKLGEIDAISIFDLDGAGTIQTGTGSLCKQFLTTEVKKQEQVKVGNNCYPQFKDFYIEFIRCIRFFTRLLDRILELDSDTGYLFSAFDSNVRGRVACVANSINSSSLSNPEEIFLPIVDKDTATKRELSAKSTIKYLNMRELVRLSNKDEDDKVMHSLLATDEDIKKAVKASPYKDVVKGAALSGLIKKKEQIIEGINKSLTYPIMQGLADLVTKYTSYVKTVFSKVKI